MTRADSALPPPRLAVGVGVFLLSLGLLLYELCLTRVLSVLFYYHTAFLAISVALLGLSAGALWIYLRGDRAEPRLDLLVAAAAAGTALLPILFPVVHLNQAQLQQTPGMLFAIKLTIATAAMMPPFLGGGAVLALVFRRHRGSVGRLYACDLVGAATGAMLLVPVMERLGGPGALLASGLPVAGAALLLADGRRRVGAAAVLLVTALMTAQIGWDPFAVPIDLTGPDERARPARVLAKKWNAFSRVVAVTNQGWSRGLSERSWRRAADAVADEVEAIIDINAYAPIVPFDGDRTKVAYLKDLVSNLAYRVLPPGLEVAIIGPGGGKDVLGALLFDARRVWGVELNPILVEDLVRDRFRTFSGDIYGDPRVEIRVGEGRAELSRLDRRFHLVLLNSVATWAASSSGAMNLAEQPLFTDRAFALYFDRLRPDGVLSISLWDAAPHALPLRILETCRTVARAPDSSPLATRSAVIGNLWGKRGYFTTVLVARAPFRAEQVAVLRHQAVRLGFEILYLPGEGDANRPEFRDYFHDPDGFAARFPRDIRPATDNRPFFFYNLPPAEALRIWAPEMRTENTAYFSLLTSAVLVAVFAAILIGGPLLRFGRGRRGLRALAGRDVLYFAAVGAGFMLVEVTLVQRMTVVLGHPTHAFTAVIAGLLCWSGLGSQWADRWARRPDARSRLRRTALVLTVALAAAQWMPAGVEAVAGSAPRWLAVALTLLALCPLGLLMGAMLPAGLTAVGGRTHGTEAAPDAIPWALGVNGAAGVLAGVAAVVIAVMFGFTAAWVLGMAGYALVLVVAPEW